VRRAIQLAQFSHGGWYGKSIARDQSALRLRIREIAHSRPRFGYLRIHVMLRREGWPVNKKRVYRWYRLEGLQIRMRVRRRKHMCVHRVRFLRPSARTSAGVWILSTISYSMEGHFGCSP
jgi:putative transposase